MTEKYYVHLEGARYYADGAFDTKINHGPCPTGDSYCEEMALKFPVEGYDWIGKDWVDMANQLILNIPINSRGTYYFSIYGKAVIEVSRSLVERRKYLENNRLRYMTVPYKIC